MPIEHADPVFYNKYDFCRIDCPECTRLDLLNGPATPRQIAEGIGNAVRAADDMSKGDVIPYPGEEG